MKNKIKLIATGTFIAMLVAANCARADAGICIYGHEVLDSVTCAGVATLDSTTVKDTVRVMGPLFAKSASLNNLNVKGVANLTNTSIKGNVDLAGTMLADHSVLQGPINLHSDDITLTGSRISAPITMESKWATPYVYLKASSQIASITFQGQPGIVVVDGSSAVVGEVINGRIQKS